MTRIRTTKPKFLLEVELTDNMAGTKDGYDSLFNPLTLKEVKDALKNGFCGVSYKIKRFEKINGK